MADSESAASGGTRADRDSPSGEPADAPRTGGILAGPLGVILFVVLFGTAVYLSYRTLTAPDPVAPEPITKTFLCVETNKPFEYTIQLEEQWPVMSPYSQKKTWYPAEKCYWTKDGRRKREPTYVILNEYLGKKGDTICPDCGRIVIGHNPPPPEGIPLAD